MLSLRLRKSPHIRQLTGLMHNFTVMPSTAHKSTVITHTALPDIDRADEGGAGDIFLLI